MTELSPLPSLRTRRSIVRDLGDCPEHLNKAAADVTVDGTAARIRTEPNYTVLFQEIHRQRLSL